MIIAAIILVNLTAFALFLVDGYQRAKHETKTHIKTRQYQRRPDGQFKRKVPVKRMGKVIYYIWL